MSNTKPRIVAVTQDATLVIGLTFAARDWDVASQPDIGAVSDADVVVIDRRDAGDGLQAVAKHSLGRVLLLADYEPEGEPPPGVVVLLRPYTVDELVGSIDHLLSPGTTDRPIRWTPSVGRIQYPAEERGPEDAADHAPPFTAADPEPATDVAPGGTSGETAPAVPAGYPESNGFDGRPLVARLLGRLRPGSIAPESVTSDDEVSDRQEESSAAAVETISHEGAGVAEPVATLDEPPSEAPSEAPGAASPAADTRPTDELVIDLVGVEPAAPVVTRQSQVELAPKQHLAPVRRTRWRARRQRDLSGPEQAFRERLARVLAATSELERLVEEVPLLEDLTSLCAAITQELGEEFDADSVGLWRPGRAGWQLRASRGFSVHERRLIVPFDQPLFAEIHASGGAMLIDPVESVQAAVAGIGGAHTESFMAAAIAAGPGRFGIAAVGRNEPLVEYDLDRLTGFVLDAAPGIAVAEQLERLRSGGRGGHGEVDGPGTGHEGNSATIVVPEATPSRVG